MGGGQLELLGKAMKGKSPYNGSMPSEVTLNVHQEVVADNFVVSVMQPDGGLVAQLSDRLAFARDLAVCCGVCEALGVPTQKTVTAMSAEIANFGYRFVERSTGATRGLTERLLLIADVVTELDAALRLGAEPDYIFGLLDGGADPMRPHVMMGRPYEVALLKAMGPRPDYWSVVEYMRACGAWSQSRTY